MYEVYYADKKEQGGVSWLCYRLLLTALHIIDASDSALHVYQQMKANMHTHLENDPFVDDIQL